MRFPDEWIESVKSSVDIVEIIGRKVQLKQSGRNFVGLCPFHAEKTPSFTVNPEKQFYHCFGCGRGGNVFNFIMETEHVSFPEAAGMLAKERGIPVPSLSPQASEREEKRRQLHKINETAARYYYRNLRQPEGRAALAYLEKRGIDKKLAREFFLGYSSPDWDDLVRFFETEGFDLNLAQQAGLIGSGRQGYIDRFRQRIIFPICDHLGRFIGFGGRSLDPDQPKYLNSSQTAVFDKSSVLYGLNWTKEAIKQADRVIIVEGYTDLISLFASGQKNVAASLGTAFTPRQARLLARFSSRAVMAFDGDTAGQKAVLAGMEVLHKNGLQVLVAPLGAGEDPDSFARSHSGEEVENWLNSAVPFRQYQIDGIISQHDVKNREGKLTASTELIKILAQLDSAIERDEYLVYVAQKLDVSPHSLRTEVSQKMGIDSGRPVQNRYNVKKKSKAAGVEGQELAEREIIRHLLLRPAVMEDLNKAGITVEDFQNPDYRHLFVSISQNQAADGRGAEIIRQLLLLAEPTGSWQEYLSSFLLVLKKRRLQKIEEKLSSLENDNVGFDLRMELYYLVKEYYRILSENP